MNAVAQDYSNGLYVAGSFSGTVDFDPGQGTYNLTSAGAKDIFVAKYDRMGRFIWAKDIGGSGGGGEANGIALDQYGDVFITGDFTGTVDFDPGPGNYSLTSAGGTDIFVEELDYNGGFLYAYRIGGPGDDRGNAIAYTGRAPVFTGSFSGTVDFGLGIKPIVLTSAGGTDIFIEQLDSGAGFWAESMGGPGDDAGLAISSYGPIVTGYFSGTADLNPSPQFTDFHTSAGGKDAFFLKFDFYGDRLVLRTFGGPGDDVANSVAPDPNNATDIYVGGYFQNTVDFSSGLGTGDLTSAGGSDAFVAKYDVRYGGDLSYFLWAQRVGGTGNDAVFGATADYSGVYSVGQFFGTVNFTPSGGVYNLYDAGQGSAFLWKLSPSGNFIYARGMGGNGPTEALGVGTAAGDFPFVGGRFQGTADFNQGFGGTATLTSAGSDDGFLAKFQDNVDMVPIANNDSYRVQTGQNVTGTSSNGISVNDVGRGGGGGTSPVTVTSPSHGLFSFGPGDYFSYTPTNGFVGTDSFTYVATDGSVRSNVATVTLTVVPTGTDPLPTLQTVPNQTIYPGQSAAYVSLAGTDADGDALTYSAQAQTLAYWLKQTYGLYEDPGGFFVNQRGQNEKYVRGTFSASGYSDPNGYWYYLLPNGDFYEEAPPYSNPTLVGTFVAHLGASFYNDPTLLLNATNDPVPVTLTMVSPGRLSVQPNAGYVGTFVVLPSVSDGANVASQSFEVTVLANQPPSLAPVPDQTMSPNPATLTITLFGSDPDLTPYGNAPQPLTYSAQAQTLQYWLKQTYGLYQDAGGYHLNQRGQNEKYVRGTSSASGYSDPNGYWYYLLPNGDFYEEAPPYTSTTLVGTLVAHLGSSFYNDPTLLLNATNDAVPVSLGITLNQLTIAPNSGYTGTFVIIASVNDGFTTVSQSFKSTVATNVVRASNLVVAGFPSPTTAGVAGSFTVTADDSNGHVVTGYTGTVHFTGSDLQAVLPADYTFTATDAGVHTFSATLKTAGTTQSITVTDTVTSTITGSQTGITVNPAAASSLVVSGFPSLVISGQAQNFSVEALDAYGNTATGYTGKVHFTSTDGGAALPADYTFLGSDAGVHTFSATLETAGTQSLTATDTATASITGAEASILVKPASFVVSSFPSPTTAGVAHSFSVIAKNANATTASGYTGTIHFTSSDGQAMLPADYTFVSADAGVHSFSATLKTAGTQSITATDTGSSTITGTQGGITVNAAVLSKLAVTGFLSPTVAGVAHSFTVTAQDAYGNTVTSYLGTVHFTSTDKKAVLAANYTFVAGDAGIHSFSATLKTAGAQTITAKDTVKTTVTGSESVLVNAAAASHLKVTAPTSSTAGAAFSITVTALDPYGNTATGYTGTIHFTSSDKKAVLPANYAFTGADAGVHVFTNGVTLKTAGSQSVTATDTVTATITGKSTVKVSAAAVDHLKITAPASVTAGTAFSITVTAQDAYNNTVTNYLGTIHFTSSDSQAVLPANYTFTGTDKGAHTFSNGVTLKTAGTQTITATDTVTATVTGTVTVKTGLAAVKMSALGLSAGNQAPTGKASTRGSEVLGGAFWARLNMDLISELASGESGLIYPLPQGQQRVWIGEIG